MGHSASLLLHPKPQGAQGTVPAQPGGEPRALTVLSSEHATSAYRLAANEAVSKLPVLLTSYIGILPVGHGTIWAGNRSLRRLRSGLVHQLADILAQLAHIVPVGLALLSQGVVQVGY